MVKSTRKGKMSKKRAGTRKIKGGSRPPTVSSPAKFSWGGLSNAFNSVQNSFDRTVHAAAPSVSLAHNVNIHDLTVKKAQRGGSKTQKGGMDLSGLLEGSTINIDHLDVEKKRQAGGMSCGSKKHSKKSKKGGNQRRPGGGKKHGGMGGVGLGGGKKHGGKKHGTKKKSMKGGNFWARSFTPPGL